MKICVDIVLSPATEVFVKPVVGQLAVLAVTGPCRVVLRCMMVQN